MVLPCCHFIVIGKGVVSVICKGSGCDALDQDIKLPLVPKVKVQGNSPLDVLCLYAAMAMTK